MTKRKYLFAVFSAGLLLAACSSNQPAGCPLPPKGFSEADLIGSWKSIEARGDTIITIREDGRYKQTVYVERTGFNHETDWLPWRVTYSEQGLPYLHLEGYLICAYWYQLECGTASAGIEPLPLGDTKDPFADEAYWFDFCQEKWVRTPGEGVFMVFGVPAQFTQPPRGISLVPFTKSPDTNTGPDFELREP